MSIQWYSSEDRDLVRQVTELMGVTEGRAVGLLFAHTDFPIGDYLKVWRQFRDWYGGRNAS